MAKEGRKRGVIGSFFRVFANVGAWVQADGVKAHTKLFKQSATGMLNTSKATGKNETFEEAKARLGLDDAAIAERLHQTVVMKKIHYVLMALVACYAIYLFATVHIRAGIIALTVIFFVGTRAVLYSFWEYQIRNKRLGCTLKEWFKSK